MHKICTINTHFVHYVEASLTLTHVPSTSSAAVLSASAYPLYATLPLSRTIATSSGTSGKYRHTFHLYVLRAVVYHTTIQDDCVYIRYVEVARVIKQKFCRH